MLSPWRRETGPTWTDETTYNNFEQFNYDYETFGGPEGFYPNILAFFHYRLDQTHYPQLFPDLLPKLTMPTSQRWQHSYHPNIGDSRLLGRAAKDMGGSGALTQPSNKEQMRQIAKEVELKQRRVEELMQELAEAEAAQNQHVKIHQLPVKGEQPEWG
ncbi:uncharacterized protein ARMOST_13843 [Armillaria ostoyae]|uniref:Uncharacterized protein n=1 Tax=Armillaria ostoyae TaxID=47428 RepID=A0A284RNX3_ARMOS|nr:uncharacterized protein ARMOST_13843 [Armillaria ostoyae]